ncbi:MAG: iron ABC transporter permease, partial [Pseudomonadota bacterium]
MAMATSNERRRAGAFRALAGAPAIFVALVGAVVLFALLGALYGPVRLSLTQLGQALIEAAAGEAASDPAASAILLHVRLPRVALGTAVGAGLALSGCALQGLFRNPLADPGLIGVMAGATVGAVAAIVLGALLLDGLPPALRPYLVPVAAFAGAALVTWLVFQVAGSARDAAGQGASIATLLLAGVALQSIALAVVGALVYVSDDQQLRDLTFWTMGGLGAADWVSVVVAVVLVAAAGAVLIGRWRALDLLQLGERAAFCAGVDVAREKRIIGVFAALAVAAAVAVAGPIGFIGLVAP